MLLGTEGREGVPRAMAMQEENTYMFEELKKSPAGTPVTRLESEGGASMLLNPLWIHSWLYVVKHDN